MMSIFSSFEAVCGDRFLSDNKGGLKSCAPLYVSKKEVNNSESSPVIQKENKRRPSSGGDRLRKQQMAARFAVELDGLNCFETIVSS